jgi:glycosyltransferase involved in cell wall biosynthesis
MKILQIIQKQQLRGAEVFAAQLSMHIVEAGHEVLIVSLGGGSAVLPFEGNIISLNANFRFKFLDWKAWKKLAVLIKEFQPDIIQANAGDTLKYAVISKKIFRWKQPVIFRNASMVSSYINNRFSKSISTFLFKNASHIISVSQYTKNDLIKYFHLKEKKITVVPIGIELQQYKRLESFDDQFINLIHVGGFSFEKNHERLLWMFQKLFSNDNRFRLWLIGDGPLMGKIKKMAEELGIEQYVFFKGFTKNPLDYIYSSKILLLPSKIEGLPAVILEAFYCKIPVVAYNVGGIGELVKNNETGWLIDFDDEIAFINTVMKISQAKKEEIQPIIEKAYNKVISHYTNGQIASAFLKVYQTLKINN